MTVYTPQPDLPPPSNTIGVFGWLRANLFSSVSSTLLTFASLYVLFLILPPAIQWAIIDADWAGTSRDDCTSGGACWVFVKVRFSQFMFGFYPEDQIWRVQTAFGILIGLATLLFIPKFPKKLWLSAFLLTIYPVIAFSLFYGGVFNLPVVETHQWGGLMLTLILAITGIVAALPIGIILALGRRADNMPLVKTFCVVMIEFWRGVPLITVLFMASVMLPLFLPGGVNFDKLLRALIGLTLFQSAYMAEVIRSGLQAVPKGQYEAAEALGLGYWRTMILVILPQALKIVIPGIVNIFIFLFKETTLVLIIGLFDLLAIVQSAFADPKWLGYSMEGYVFTAAVFWMFCFSMSRYSQHLERQLHTGHRRNP